MRYELDEGTIWKKLLLTRRKEAASEFKVIVYVVLQTVLKYLTKHNWVIDHKHYSKIDRFSKMSGRKNNLVRVGPPSICNMALNAF